MFVGLQKFLVFLRSASILNDGDVLLAQDSREKVFWTH